MTTRTVAVVGAGIGGLTAGLALIDRGFDVTVFEQSNAKFTILDAEPQKVNRVKIELLPQPMPEPQEAHSGK